MNIEREKGRDRQREREIGREGERKIVTETGSESERAGNVRRVGRIAI